ncbi:MAG: hypothetical protein ACODAD_14885 [Planctomycetota bacterium]
MADDLEAFLRQVAQRRAGAGQPVNKPGSAAGQPDHNPPRASQSPESDEEIIDAETVASDSVPLRRDMGNRQKDQRSQRGVGSKDRRDAKAEWEEGQLREYVHQSLDHPVGARDGGPGMPNHGALASEDTAAPATEIARLLANPQSLKNAIILSEILSAPHISW